MYTKPHSAYLSQVLFRFFVFINFTYNFVPVKLPDCALMEMLLGGSNIVALRKILNHLSARPTSGENTSPGQGERPFQVGNGTTIGALLAKAIGVLEVKLVVCPTYIQLSACWT